MERWLEMNTWLFQDQHPDDLPSLFPLTSSPLADRRVADVKFRILTNSAVLRYTEPICPHCLEPDSSEHRFWNCVLARRERAQVSQICPDITTLCKATILLAPQRPPIGHASAVKPSYGVYTYLLGTSWISAAIRRPHYGISLRISPKIPKYDKSGD